MSSAIAPETAKDAARRLAAKAIADGYRPAALHEYQGAAGEPLFWRIRAKHENGSKWIRPMHWDGCRYVMGEPPAPPQGKPLYRLPALLTEPAAPVWIVEGEHCADTLARLGLTVTTSGGADSASAADWSALTGRRCLIWPDHDEPGTKYAQAVTAALQGLGCAVEWIDCQALGLTQKGADCVDWLALHSGVRRRRGRERCRCATLAAPSGGSSGPKSLHFAGPVPNPYTFERCRSAPPGPKTLHPWRSAPAASQKPTPLRAAACPLPNPYTFGFRASGPCRQRASGEPSAGPGGAFRRRAGMGC